MSGNNHSLNLNCCQCHHESNLICYRCSQIFERWHIFELLLPALSYYDCGQHCGDEVINAYLVLFAFSCVSISLNTSMIIEHL